MGRIADALRRAEQERRLATGTAVEDPPLEGGYDPFASSQPSIATIPEPEPDHEDEPISVVEGLSESLVPFHEKSSLVTEQYRSLRTRILSMNPQYEHRILAITSAVPKEGKSVTTLNLGCILAEIRHLKVLVIDGDFRRSTLARMLNQEEGPGLADVLAGRAAYEKVVRQTPIRNLSFIPAGSTNNRSAAELLTAASAKQIFKRIQNEYHYVIVDTPPATTVTDVGIIGQLCHGVIMVVRLHRTDELAAKRATRLLQSNNIPILGCLLVGRDAPPGRYGYGYGYAYNYYRYYDYYRYYKHQEDDS